MSNKHTAYIVNGHLFHFRSEENVFEAQARLVSLWRDIAVPNLSTEGPAIKTRSDISRAAFDLWPESEYHPMPSYGELWRYFPERADVTIWDLRSNLGRQSEGPLVPMIAQLRRKPFGESVEFVSVEKFSSWTAMNDPLNNDDDPSYVIDAWMGAWNFGALHGDHLASLADRAEEVRAPYAEQLRKQADDWQAERDERRALNESPETSPGFMTRP